MLSFQRLQHSSSSLFRSLTGLQRKEFADLLGAFTEALDHDQAQRDQRPGRQRAPGAGGTSDLREPRQALLFILLYFKQYPTQDLMGILFGKTQPWACKWVHRLAPVLEQALGKKLLLPLRQTDSMAELTSRCPELEFIIDGTERPVARPTKEPAQTEQYSGKKKRHTKKNIVVTRKKTKVVVVLGPTEPGSKHDKRMLDEADITFPPGSVVLQDTGFQGHGPPDIAVKQPTKKPRHGDLTSEQKAQNREISRHRIGVEHSIGGIKISRITREELRNRRTGFADRVMVLAAGLHNQRMETKMKRAA